MLWSSQTTSYSTHTRLIVYTSLLILKINNITLDMHTHNKILSLTLDSKLWYNKRIDKCIDITRNIQSCNKINTVWRALIFNIYITKQWCYHYYTHFKHYKLHKNDNTRLIHSTLLQTIQHLDKERNCIQ